MQCFEKLNLIHIYVAFLICRIVNACILLINLSKKINRTLKVDVVRYISKE